MNCPDSGWPMTRPTHSHCARLTRWPNSTDLVRGWGSVIPRPTQTRMVRQTDSRSERQNYWD